MNLGMKFSTYRLLSNTRAEPRTELDGENHIKCCGNDLLCFAYVGLISSSELINP